MENFQPVLIRIIDRMAENNGVSILMFIILVLTLWIGQKRWEKSRVLEESAREAELLKWEASKDAEEAKWKETLKAIDDKWTRLLDQNQRNLDRYHEYAVQQGRVLEAVSGALSAHTTLLTEIKTRQAGLPAEVAGYLRGVTHRDHRDPQAS